MTLRPTHLYPKDIVEASRQEQLERKLLSRVQKTSKRYALFAPGDKIMVAISGGKDSYTMLHLMGKLQRRLPFSIEFVAVHLDQQQPGYDGASLRNWLTERDYAFEILSEDTYSVVTDHLEPTQTYCSLCSRLRRGILYTAAGRLGCNKIALGHHRDDTLETFLLNLFYAGKMQAMPAIYTTDDQRFQVIRPLIECAESQIAEFSGHMDFPIIPCNLCGSQPQLKRDQMTNLMAQLEAEHPHLKSVMMNALQNVRPTHLLDLDVQQAWGERRDDIRPQAPAKARPEHAAAEPVLSRTSKLRVIK